MPAVAVVALLLGLLVVEVPVAAAGVLLAILQGASVL
jgi:hypothetical protein